MQTDWSNYRLNDLSRYPEIILSGCVDSLRAWTEIHSSAAESGGYHGHKYRLITADDLLDVPSNRRNACFTALKSLLLSLKSNAENPEQYILKALLSQNTSVTPGELRAYIEKSISDDVIRSQMVLVWTDDRMDEEALNPGVIFR